MSEILAEHKKNYRQNMTKKRRGGEPVGSPTGSPPLRFFWIQKMSFSKKSRFQKSRFQKNTVTQIIFGYNKALDILMPNLFDEEISRLDERCKYPRFTIHVANMSTV